MIKNWMALMLALTIGLVQPGLPASGAGIVKKSAATAHSPKEAPESDQRDDEIRSVFIGLQEAFASKAPEKAAALFAENAIFIDQAGDETRGRQSLQDRFTARSKQDTAYSIAIHPESINFLAANVALAVGDVSRKQGGEDLPATKFSMVLVKQNTGWKISEVSETLIQAAQIESHLQDLDWMIGEWQVNNPGISAQLNAEWAPGKKFVVSKCTVNKGGNSPQIDTQIIGWDPHSNSIISWHFDSNGGYGSGNWSKRSDQNEWSVAVHGTGADGSTTSATNVFSLKNANEFTWQSVLRKMNDTPVADTDLLTVQRVKH